jgi:hypothetical protein
MSDILLPMHLRQSRTAFRYLDSTGVSRATFTSALTTAAKGGDKLAASLQFTPHGGASTDGRSERAQLRSFLASLRGRQNRPYLTDLSYRRRGNFPTGELIPNGTFANGTAGWTAPSNSSLSATDRVLRVTRTLGDTGSSGANPTSDVTILQYVPYVARACFSGSVDIATTPGLGVYFFDNAGSNLEASNFLSNYGMATVAAVPRFTDARIIVVEGNPGRQAGAYFTCPYVSLSRCALVDNGANSLLQSEALDNAAWTKTNCSITTTAGTAPDGNAVADYITENTANSLHQVVQAAAASATAVDLSFSVALKQNGRTWAVLEMYEGTNAAGVYFDIVNGVIGTINTGANWSNVRGNIASLGDGWFQCTIVARKTSASASIICGIYLASANGTVSYTGTGAFGLIAWRPTFAQSSVPTRLVRTTSAAQSATGQTGSAIYLKGLPASTNGLLEKDDQVEFITARGSELKLVTDRLNSDAAGLGYLRFEPPIRTSPADSAAVIIHNPMGRFIFTGDAVGWDNDPGFWSTASAEFEEAV